MSDQTVTKRIIRTVEDLGPGVRPQSVKEQDEFVYFRRGDGTMGQVHRRMRTVTLIAPDQNRTYEVKKDMGRATGEDDILVPCDGLVEMAQIHELLDQAVEKRRERDKARASLLPAKQESIRNRLHEMGLIAIEEQAGRSVFGPYQRTERSSY